MFGEPIVIALDIVACVLAADFLSGFVHWIEDSYGDVDFPIIGIYITRPNILHHYDPRHFVKNNDWIGRLRTSAFIALLFVCLAAFFKFFSWQFLLTLLIGINANEVHKWSHSSAKENGMLITFLQRAGLIQSPGHHAMHHRGRRNTNYCVVTNFLNPILDGIRFWRGLELTIGVLTGLRKRVDPTLRYAVRQHRSP
ncbi:MAG TPA: fatty acid desaturase CarF family protein [Oculatellaceae cyanobacterium]